jgi:hypothetical protein
MLGDGGGLRRRGENRLGRFVVVVALVGKARDLEQWHGVSVERAGLECCCWYARCPSKRRAIDRPMWEGRKREETGVNLPPVFYAPPSRRRPGPVSPPVSPQPTDARHSSPYHHKHRADPQTHRAFPATLPPPVPTTTPKPDHISPPTPPHLRCNHAYSRDRIAYRARRRLIRFGSPVCTASRPAPVPGPSRDRPRSPSFGRPCTITL